MRMLWKILIALTVVMGSVSFALGEDAYVIPEGYDPFPEWSISGNNTFRYEWYKNRGDSENSIHSITGSQYYDEIALEFSKENNEYDSIKGSFNGVENESEYRYDSKGFIPEQFSLVREKGDVPVPVLFRMGDYYGFYTDRTFQKSLKGIQVELQPNLDKKKEKNHSFVLSGGTAALRNYKEGSPADDLYYGGSWLINAKPVNFTLNLMRNSRKEDNETQTPKQEQDVYSLGTEYEKKLAGQVLTFEGEVAYFDGDLQGQGPNIGRDRSDQGYFFQVRGKSERPLTYDFKFEDYGMDFQPNGAVVSPDRRTWESHAGWRFEDGFGLNGRVQRYISGREAGNALTTDVVGLNASGAVGIIPIKGLNMSYDGFINESENDDRTTDTKTVSSRLDFSMPIKEGLSGRLGGSVQRAKDNLTSIETDSYQTSAGITRALSINSLDGGISTNASYTKTDVDPGEHEDQYGLDLGLNLAGEYNSFNASYRYQKNNPHATDTINTATHAINASNTYSIGPHSFTTEVEMNKRDPQASENSIGYRVAAFWTFKFSKPSKKARKAALEEARAPEEKAKYIKEISLDQLTPGAPLKVIIERLGQGGIKGGVELPGMVVFPTQFFEEISQRQQLAVLYKDGIVTKAAITIELEDIGTPDTAMQVFERVRRILIRNYGTPEIFERGELSDNLVEDINQRGVIRIAEWTTDSGIIRLGIPKRLDQKVRIEIQYATQFPPPSMQLWSIEALQ